MYENPAAFVFKAESETYVVNNVLRNTEDFRQNIIRRTRNGSNWPSKVCSNRINICTCIIRKTLPLALHRNNIFKKYRAIHFSWSLPAYTLNDISNDAAVSSEQAQNDATWGHSNEFNKKIPRDNLKLANSDVVHYFRSYVCWKTCIFGFVVYRRWSSGRLMVSNKLYNTQKKVVVAYLQETWKTT